MPEPYSLPHNLDAERSTLGALMVARDAAESADRVAAVAEILDDGDWFRDAHPLIWRAIVRVSENGAPVDLVTVRDELDRAGVLDTVGGPAYVASLPDGMPRSTNFAHYARIVQRHAVMRKLIVSATGARFDATVAFARQLVDLVTSRDDDELEHDSLADLSDVEAAPVVAHNLAYGGRLGLIHGPAGGGKTTVVATATGAITSGGDFAGEPTMTGDVVICAEDVETWRTMVHAAGGDLARVKVRSGRKLAGAVRELRPVAAFVDTLQYVAAANGSGELDSAMEVDRILRPLEALARETGAAITIIDHEPWSDGRTGDSATGTQARPRHSGAKGRIARPPQFWAILSVICR